MLSSFDEVLKRTRLTGGRTLSVAAAQDEEVLRAVKAAYDQGLARAILVGDAALIKPIAGRIGLPDGIRIIDEPDTDEAARIAVDLICRGEADILMKGRINSSNFLSAALNREHGLRSEGILVHMAAFEIPGVKKLVYHVDGGMNIAPTLEEKKEILSVTIRTLRKIGIERPKVAVLAANEQVSAKMPVTVEAKALVDMAQKGLLPPCVIEGPIAMDVAASAEAARHKGIESQIAGDVDIFLVPDIEAGNMVGKTLVNYANAKMAGVVIGATHPIVLTSRAESAESKLNSIALACLIASESESKEQNVV
jgi:phosphate butyryltransferase